jgi:hypothetical protein
MSASVSDAGHATGSDEGQDHHCRGAPSGAHALAAPAGRADRVTGHGLISDPGPDRADLLNCS